MSSQERVDSVEEAEAVAQAVEDGRDGISIPEDLAKEAAPDAPEVDRETLYNRVKTMPVGARIKLAMRGNKETRILLIRDSNRLVARFVLRNPRITEDEIVAITTNRTADDELLRVIADSREWTRSRLVRGGLVSNPRTPPPIALRFLPTLDDRDIRRLAKSKNVPDVVAMAARRLVAVRDQRGRT